MQAFGSVRFRIIVFCLIVIYLFYNIIPTWVHQSKIEFPFAVLKRLPFESYRSNSTSTFERCYFPKIPPSRELTLLFRKSPPLSCEQKQLDWAVCEKSVCYVKETVLEKESNVKCIFIELLFNKGLGTYDGPFMKDVVRYVLRESDVVKVYCKSQENTWSSILVGFRNATPSPNRSIPRYYFFGIPKNILVIGFASISRNTFINKLPRTYNYLTNQLDGDVLQGYNVVDDTGEFSLLYPLLTGKNKEELRDLGNSMDDYHFIWKRFKKSGYVTAHIDDFTLWSSPNDVPNFQSVPTDRYIQQYYTNARGRVEFWPQFCSGSVPRHKILLNYIRDFFAVYKSRRKFLFSFHGEITHSNFNGLDVIDDDLFNLLIFLDNLDVLRKTMLIIVSDKSYKFSSIKDSLHMKQEEMSPFLYVRLPTMFSRKYPNHYMNFKKNIKGLVTPYDLHYTLMNILEPIVYNGADRANSLFQHIPYERSCSSAEIATGLCSCWIKKHVPEAQSFTYLLRPLLEVTLNDITRPLRDKCEEITVISITNFTRMVPNLDLSRYTDDSDHYIVSALALPGYTIYEARILYDKKIKKFFINPQEITAYDYGLHGFCIKNNSQIRKFCYCKDQY